MQNTYYIEVTDTFSGEANYSWITRHAIKANTMRGAINRFSRMSGMNWHCVGDYSDSKRYDSESGATCFFIEEYDPDQHGNYRFDTDERN